MSSPEDRMPCGRSRSWLLDVAAADAPDPADAEHLRICPQCREELARLQRSWSAVRLAARQPVRTPGDLVARSTATLRAVRGGLVGRHAEAPQTGGVVRIAESALVLLARRMAYDVVDGLPGVYLRGVSGGMDGLVLRLAVRYGYVLADVGARVRHELGAALTASVGPAAPPLEVQVEDVLAPRSGDIA